MMSRYCHLYIFVNFSEDISIFKRMTSLTGWDPPEILPPRLAQIWSPQADLVERWSSLFVRWSSNHQLKPTLISVEINNWPNANMRGMTILLYTTPANTTAFQSRCRGELGSRKAFSIRAGFHCAASITCVDVSADLRAGMSIESFIMWRLSISTRFTQISDQIML